MRASDWPRRRGRACCRGKSMPTSARASKKASLSERSPPRIADSPTFKVEGTLLKENARLGLAQQAETSLLPGQIDSDKRSGVEEGVPFGAIPTLNLKVANRISPRRPFERTLLPRIGLAGLDERAGGAITSRQAAGGQRWRPFRSDLHPDSKGLSINRRGHPCRMRYVPRMLAPGLVQAGEPHSTSCRGSW
jgi:hypothetical protein